MKTDQEFVAPTQKRLHVVSSGFETSDKKIYREIVEKLGGIYCDNLSMDTDVLVASTANSLKYNAAGIINIPVVCAKWLSNSFNKERFLPFDDYILPFFAGITIGALGFNESENEDIKILVAENEGFCETNLEKIINAKKDRCHVVVVKQQQSGFYKNCIEAIDIPVVSIDWFKNCFIQRRYLRTAGYLISSANQDNKDGYLLQLGFPDSFASKILMDFECSDRTFNYLSRCVVYVYSTSDKTEKIQKKLVATGGGFFVKSFLPCVTHVVVESYSENAYLELSKYRDVKIVNPLWLADCLIYRRRVNEEDYYVRPLPNHLSLDDKSRTLNRASSDSRVGFDSRVDLSRRNSFMTNLQTQPNGVLGRQNSALGLGPAMKDVNWRNSSTGFSLDKKTPTLSKYDSAIKQDKRTASELASPSKTGKKPKSPMQPRAKSRKQPPKPVSKILKDCRFCLDSNLEEQGDIYWKTILENGGRVIENINDFEEIYWVLADCPDSFIKINKNDKKQNLKFISWRWIDASLSKKRPIENILAESLLQYLPFPHKTPYESFKDKQIYVAGFEPKKKYILKEILQTLGAKVIYDPKILDVLVVDKKDSKKYLEIIKNYSHIPIVDADWVLSSVQTGQYVTNKGNPPVSN